MKRYTVKSQNTPIYSTAHTPSTMQFEGKKWYSIGGSMNICWVNGWMNNYIVRTIHMYRFPACAGEKNRKSSNSLRLKFHITSLQHNLYNKVFYIVLSYCTFLKHETQKTVILNILTQILKHSTAKKSKDVTKCYRMLLIQLVLVDRFSKTRVL